MTYILQPSSKEMGSKVVTQEIEDDKEFKVSARRKTKGKQTQNDNHYQPL